MEYNVIATDLDGTLLTSNKKVTEKTKKVLTILKSKGFFILGITARNLSSVKGVVDINLFDYLILNNGSDIYDINRNTSRNINHINKDIIKCDFIKPHSICNYENNSDIYRILECHKCISENFYLLIEHSLGKTISNTLNISVPPIYDFPK